MVDKEKMQMLRDKISGYQLIIDNVMEQVMDLSSSPGPSNLGMIKAIIEHVREMQSIVDDMKEKHDYMLEEHLKTLTRDNTTEDDEDDSPEEDMEESNYNLDIYDILDSINSPEHRELVRLMMMSEDEMKDNCSGMNLELMMDYMDSMSFKEMMTVMEVVDRYHEKTQEFIDKEYTSRQRLNRFMQRRDMLKEQMMRRKLGEEPYMSQYDLAMSYKKGQRVSWAYGEGRGTGTIISIHTSKITKNINGTEVTRNGTTDNPAVYINSDEGNNVLKLSSELRAVKKGSAQDIEEANVKVGQRVSWAGGVNRGTGTVVSVHKKPIKKTINGISVMVQGTEENPAVVIKADSGTEVLKRESDLQLMQQSNPKNNKDLKTKAAKYDHINFKPTESMAAVARQGLDWRDKYNRGGTSVGIARARDIANRKNLSPDTINRMVSFFARHEQNKDGKLDNGEPSNGKIAWCLRADTEILLEDGTHIPIKDIVDKKLRVNVMSLNEETGILEPKPVINWIKSDSNYSEFVKIGRFKTKRWGVSNKTTLYTTKDHKVITDKGWITADNLEDKNYLVVDSYPDQIAKQVMLGTLLGDGHLDILDSGSCRLAITHCAKQRDWLATKIKLTPNLNWSPIKSFIPKASYGKGKEQFSSRSSTFRYQSDIFIDYVSSNKIREVTLNTLKNLDWLGIATWIADDGSLHLSRDKGSSLRLHVENFSEKSVNVIIEFFNSRGLYPKKYKRSNTDGYVLYFTGESLITISSNIAKFLPISMKYKVLPEHRGIEFALEDYKSCIEFGYTFEKVEYVEDLALSSYVKRHEPSKYRKKYDLTIQDNHNFIANGIVVHNCLWGGDPGRSWANARKKQMNAADKK